MSVDAQRPNGFVALVSKFESHTAVTYWQRRIATDPDFTPAVEHYVVLFLAKNGSIRGHRVLKAVGLSAIQIVAQELFRTALIVGYQPTQALNSIADLTDE